MRYVYILYRVFKLWKPKDKGVKTRKRDLHMSKQVTTIRQFLNGGLFKKGNYIIIFNEKREKVFAVSSENYQDLLSNPLLVNEPIVTLYQYDELTHIYIK